MKRTLAKLVAVTLVATMLIGCGSKGDNGSKGDSGSKSGNVTELVADSSFEMATEDGVSNDLTRWLLAVTGVYVEGQGWDSRKLGGDDHESMYISAIESHLESQWGVSSKDDALDVATQLVGEAASGNERAFNLASAEGILAMSYACEFLEFNEYLEYAVPVGKLIQQDFTSWDEYGDSYVAGFMAKAGEGVILNASSVSDRMVAQQKFVSEAKYYTNLYAIDFDMELKTDCYSTFFDNMPRELDKTGLDSKRPEFIEGYIAPEELGTNVASGNVEIEGDLYHVPFTVQAVLDNGWEAGATGEKTNNGSLVEFSRDGKKMTLSVASVGDYTDVKDGYVYYLDANEMGDVSLVLPSDLKVGSSVSDATSALGKTGNSYDSGFDLIEVNATEGQYKISYIYLYGTVSIENIVVSSDATKSVWVLENFFEGLEEDYSDYYSMAQSIRGKVFDYRDDIEKSDVSQVEMSDNPEDYKIHFAEMVIELPVSYSQLESMGFTMREAADDPVPVDEMVILHTYYLGSENLEISFKGLNRSGAESTVGELVYQAATVTIYGLLKFDTYSFILSGDIPLGCTRAEVEEIYGKIEDLNYKHVKDPYDEDLIWYGMEYDTGSYGFLLDKDDNVVGIEVNKFQNKK